MNGRVGNVRALGFGVFATGVWLYSMSLAGFMPVTYGKPLHGIAVFVGIGLIVAGVTALLRHESWLGFFFILWAAASWGVGASFGLGWFWLALALMNLYLWLAAGRAGHAPAVGLVALLVGIDALGQGLYGVAGLNLAGLIGAYFGLAAAAFAFYVSAAAIMCPAGCERMPFLASRREPEPRGREPETL
jgi:hypothetical protein